MADPSHCVCCWIPAFAGLPELVQRLKGAVITTSRSLAAELGPDNIRVNCVNPVFNPDTGLSPDFAGGPLDEDRKACFRASIPLGRFSTAPDVANAVLYLASDEADFISGVCLEVDGARCV